MTLLALLTVAALGTPAPPAATSSPAGAPAAAPRSGAAEPAATRPTAVVDLAAVTELRRLTDRYLALKTLRLDFRERYTNEATGTVVEETGVLVTARPGRMRWEYQHPEKKLFIQRGAVAWFYVPEEEVAYRMDSAGDGARGLPTLFLAGDGDLSRDYQAALVESADPARTRIKLVPLVEGEGYDHLLLEIDAASASVLRMVVVDPLGNQTEFEFSGERRNTKAADDLFEFEPPPGIDIVHSTRR